jgi:putative ABC transport system substrate-binding protein
MRKFFECQILSVVLVALCSSASAQQLAKMPRIGFLVAVSPSAFAARDETQGTPPRRGFRLGLRDLGYVEGKNIVIESRYAEGKLDRLPALAAELVRLKVDVIITGGSVSTRAAKAATSTIPIVMTREPDPVGEGFIASLARPGGNITGLATLAPEISGKQLEILKETVPKLSRVAVLGTSTVPGHALQLKEIGLAAGSLSVQLQYLDVLGPKDIETAFRTASDQRAEALIVFGGDVLVARATRTRIFEYVVKNRLPAIYRGRQFVEAGGLMSYWVNLTDLDRRATVYVDKILKGANPADLPVEQPIKFEFVVNLKAAKEIGLTIPPNVLARADRVIR